MVADDVPTHIVGDSLIGGDHTIRLHDTETAARIGARRSWHTTKTLEPGYIIRRSDVAALRPGGGMEPSTSVEGRVVKRHIEAGVMLDNWMLT